MSEAVMSADPETYRHGVIGSVHWVRPGDDPEAIRLAIAHEMEGCGSERVVLDLTDRATAGPEDLHIILRALETTSDHDHWRIVLAPTRAHPLAEMLEDAGWGDVVEVDEET